MTTYDMNKLAGPPDPPATLQCCNCHREESADDAVEWPKDSGSFYCATCAQCYRSCQSIGVARCECGTWVCAEHVHAVSLPYQLGGEKRSAELQLCVFCYNEYLLEQELNEAAPDDLPSEAYDSDNFRDLGGIGAEPR